MTGMFMSRRISTGRVRRPSTSIASAPFRAGETAGSLGLHGREVFAIRGLEDGNASEVQVTAASEAGGELRFAARLRIETPHERDYLRHGGILPYALRKALGR